MFVHTVIAQIGEVALVETTGPGRDGAQQLGVEQAAAAGMKSSVLRFARLAPPARFVPRISRQLEQAARGRHRGEAQIDTEAMEIVGRFDQRFLLALAAGGRNNLGLLAFAPEALLDGNGQRRVRAQFQPDINTVLRH